MFQAISPTPHVWWDSELFAGWVKSSFETMGIDLRGERAVSQGFPLYQKDMQAKKKGTKYMYIVYAASDPNLPADAKGAPPPQIFPNSTAQNSGPKFWRKQEIF